MTYYDRYSQCKDEEELIAMMESDATMCCVFFPSKDRLRAIEQAGNRVSDERGWTPSREVR